MWAIFIQALANCLADVGPPIWSLTTSISWEFSAALSMLFTKFLPCSLTNAIFISLCVFSITLAASASWIFLVTINFLQKLSYTFLEWLVFLKNIIFYRRIVTSPELILNVIITLIAKFHRLII